MNFKDLLNNIRNAFTSVKLGPSEGQKKIARFVTGSSPTSEYGYQPNILLNAAAQAQRGVNALAEMPRFNFAQQVSQKVSNPYGRFATEFALGIPESILNTPSLYLRGVTGVGQELGKVPRGEANLVRALSRSGELGESILNVLTAGTAGSVTSQLGKQSLKQAMKTGAKTAGKEGVKLGVGYGLATGVRDDNATNQTVGNQLQSGALSALGGGLLGGALGVGTGATAPIVSSQLRRATAKLPIKNVLEESRKNLSASKKRFKDLLGPRTADSRVGGYIDFSAKVGGEAPKVNPLKTLKTKTKKYKNADIKQFFDKNYDKLSQKDQKVLDKVIYGMRGDYNGDAFLLPKEQKVIDRLLDGQNIGTSQTKKATSTTNKTSVFPSFNEYYSLTGGYKGVSQGRDVTGDYINGVIDQLNTGGKKISGYGIPTAENIEDARNIIKTHSLNRDGDLARLEKAISNYIQATAPKATTTTKATQQVATKPQPSGMITPKKTIMDVVEELRNKSQIAPKSVTTTQPAQPTQAEITDQSYKYLTTKLPKEVVDDLISSGFTPGQIRTAMVNTPQKTYDKLIKDPRYARNYVNVMMNGKKKPRVELQDDYMESLVQSEQPLKPPAPKATTTTKATQQVATKPQPSGMITQTDPLREIGKQIGKLNKVIKENKYPESLEENQALLKDLKQQYSSLKGASQPQSKKQVKPKLVGDVKEPTTGLKREFERATLGIYNRIRATGNYGKQIAKLHEEASYMAERMAGVYNDQLQQVRKNLTKDQIENFADYVEGKLPIDTPQLQQAVQTWRKIADEIHTTAAQNNLNPNYIQNYFPHRGGFQSTDELVEKLVQRGIDREKATVAANNYMSSLSERKFSSLDYSRDLPGIDYEKNFDVLFDYVRGASNRIVQAEKFGVDDSILYNLAEKTKDPKSVKEYLDQLLEKGRYSGPQKYEDISKAVRGFQTITKLNPLTSALNLTQGINPLIKSDPQSFASGVVNIIKNPEMAYRKATQLGEISPDVVRLFGEDYKKSSITGKWIKLIGMYGTERFNRVLSVSVADDFINKLVRQAKEGNEAAVRELKRFNLTPNSNTYDIDNAVKRFSRETQFSAPAGELPASAQTPIGKAVTQFKSFAYQQTKFVSREFIRDFQELKNGNPKPLGNTLIAIGIAAPIAGEILADLRALVKNNDPSNRLDFGQLGEDLQTLGSSDNPQDREEAINRLASRYVENVAAGFSLGLLDNISGITGEYGFKGFVGSVGGPTASTAYDVGTVGKNIFEAKQNYDEEKSLLENVDPNYQGRRFLTKMLPAVGPTVSNTIYPNAYVNNVYGGVNVGLSQPDKEIYNELLSQGQTDQAELFKKSNKFSEKDFTKKELAGDVAPNTVGELNEYKKMTTDMLDRGLIPSATRIKETYFNKDLSKPKERSEALSKLYSLMESDYSDEQKQAILQASGISETDFSYYQIAKLQEPERRELISSIFESFESTDRDKAIMTVISMKRKLGNNAAVSNTDIDFLYDIGAISKKEKELMNAVKYDEASEKFYIDRDYKAKTSGGSSKDSPGRTRTNIKTIIDKVNKLFEQKPIEEPKRKITDLFPQTPKLTTSTQKQPIRKVARMKSRPKNYWFTPY